MTRDVRSTTCRILPLLVAATIIISGSTPAAASDSLRVFEQRIEVQEKELDRLRGEIHNLRKRDKDLGLEERNTAKQLRILDRESALTADLLRNLTAKQKRISTELEGIRAEHAKATEVLAERRWRLGQTLRAMYVRRSARTADVLLRATNLRDALSHFRYLEVLARNNERLVLEIREQEEYLARTNAKLTQTLAEISSTTEETLQEKKRLTSSQRARKTALQRVRQQRSEYKQALTDLSRSERKVQSVIQALEKRRQEAIATGEVLDSFPDVGFAKLRGRMPWPVRGRLIKGFGRHRHPKHGTETFNSGIDVAAKEGSPVRCVARGRVEYVAWLDGYGRTVILNHGGGYYTVYAHLSETLIRELQEVAPGRVIGRVGDTGSLDGPKLHFEIRAQAKAVDPRGWLAR